MTSETSTISHHQTKQTRVLPEWMIKRHPCSPSKDTTARDLNLTTTAGIEEASSTKENHAAVIEEEQDTKEENVCPVGNENSVQRKIHQLSDEEEEIKDEVCKQVEEEEECKAEEELCTDEEGKCKEAEEDDKVPAAEDESDEGGASKVQVPDIASGVPSATSSQNSISLVQRITWRVLCNYGAKCYRKNPEHKKDYCHPWDEDYDTLFNSLPACPYGSGCYRKNKAHWQTNSHPTSMTPSRPAKRTCNPKTPATRDSDSDLEDDNDSVDSFLNDASSDDYQPTDTGSDSDIVSDGDEEDSEPDAKRTKKEAKKFLRKKK